VQIGQQGRFQLELFTPVLGSMTAQSSAGDFFYASMAFDPTPQKPPATADRMHLSPSDIYYHADILAQRAIDAQAETAGEEPAELEALYDELVHQAKEAASEASAWKVTAAWAVDKAIASRAAEKVANGRASALALRMYRMAAEASAEMKAGAAPMDEP
jgi:hypothetical protein